MSSKLKLSQLRICVEKISQEHEEEILNLKKSGASLQALSAAFNVKKLWPSNSVITIAFLSSGENIQRTPIEALRGDEKESENLKIDPLQDMVESMSIQEAIKEIIRQRLQPIINLKLKFIENAKKANVRISFDPDSGSWSLVGTDCLRQKEGATMNFGWFDVATTIHEFCHMLGMIHEHQNPKNNPIEWDNKKVYEWAKVTQGWSKEIADTNILLKSKMEQINGSFFDPLSIMLYFFPKTLTLDGHGTHQNLRLSGLDVEWISKMYPSSSNESPEQFYEKVYNEDIEDSVSESLSASKKFEEGEGGFNWKAFSIYLILFFLFVMICGVIFYYRHNAKIRKD